MNVQCLVKTIALQSVHNKLQITANFSVSLSLSYSVALQHVCMLRTWPQGPSGLGSLQYPDTSMMYRIFGLKTCGFEGFWVTILRCTHGNAEGKFL